MQKEMTLADLNPNLQISKQMSKRYVWMNTQELVENLLSLKSKGEQVFELRSIQGKRTRKQSTAGRGIHLVRLKMVRPFEINGEVLYPEILIKNSYDGSCPLVCELGIFRLVCTNGLVVKSKDLGGIKIRHTGTPWEACFDIVKGLASNLPKMMTVQQQLAHTNLDSMQITEFAKRAAKIRWENISEDADVEDFIAATRPEDEGSSLWKMFNVVQEKLLQGGIKLEGMRKTGRKIRNASEDLRINQELFELAMEYVQSSEGEVELTETI